MAIYGNLEGTFKNDFTIGKSSKINLGNDSGAFTIDLNETESFKLNTDGNVGLGGIATPLASIHITKNEVVPSIILERLDSGTANVLGSLSFGNSTDNQLALISAVEDGANDSAYLSFQVEKTGEALAEALRIDSSGNINIVSGALQYNGIDINTGGTLNNIAYLDQGNIFTASTNTFSNAGSAAPIIYIVNTNADALPSILSFAKDSASPVDDDELGRIYFRGDDSGGAGTNFALISGFSSDITDGDEAGEITFEVRVDGVFRNMFNINGYNGAVNQGEIVLNEDAQDVDFRVEAVGQANALFVRGSDGKIGFGVDAPQEHLHISGTGVQRLEVESTENSVTALKITNASGSYGWYMPTGDSFRLYDFTDSKDRISVDGNGAVFIGDTANTLSTQGLTINQGAADNEILSFKSSDIAHGLTSRAETDTYASWRKESAGGGGLRLWAITDGDEAIATGLQLISAVRDTADTTTTIAGRGIIELHGKQHDGADNESAIAADGNLCVIKNDGQAKHIFKGDGDIYTDTDQTGGLAGTFDKENDILLARAAQLEVKGYKEHNLKKHTKRLQELGIMKGSFLSHRKITDLQLGAINQLFNIIKGLSEKLNISEKELFSMAQGA